MELKDRIKNLCKQNGISLYKLEETLGFGRGYISKLNSSTPNTAKIKQIAEYFNISVDYLMDRNDSSVKYYINEETAETAQQIFENDKVLFDVYRSADKERLIEYAKRLKALRDMEEGGE